MARVMAGQGAVSLTSFITVLALGRYSGAADLGVFALGWSCWFLALSLIDTLVATPYTYFQAQKKPIADDLPMAAAWGVAGLCLGFGVALTALWRWDLWGLARLWPALPVAVMAAAWREFVRRHLLAAGRASPLLWLDATSSLLQLAAIAALAALDKLSASNAFWAIAASALVPLLPRLDPARVMRLLAARRQAARVLAAFFGYGSWLLAGGLCHVASVQAYPWLAFAAGGERLAGLFAACNALLNVLAPLLTGLTNYLRPRFMAAQVLLPGPAFVAYVLRRAPVFVLPALLLWLVVHVAGESLLVQIYGPAFGAAASALSWLGLGTMAVALAAPLQLGLLALRAPATNLAYHASALLILALAVLLATGEPSITALGQIYGGANLAAAAVLGWLFFSLASRKRISSR